MQNLYETVVSKKYILDSQYLFLQGFFLQPRRKTKREQRDASIEGLLNAALSLFVSQGYRQTNVDEIAKRAGLSKGAVYFYFSSKEDLLYGLFDQVKEAVIDRMLATLAVAGPSARAKIAAFINGQAALGIVDPDRVCFSF